MHAKPKKRLGQNFLVDKNIQRKIINACELGPCDTVLEIGAGRGELTSLIAERVDRVYALEIDVYLCGLLKEKMAAYSNFEIINTDVLSFNLRKHYKKLKGKIKVIGNIPYYLSSPIIEHLFKFREKIGTVFITMQKELAQRMVAVPGSRDYGPFSCFVQYYSEPKIIFGIKKSCFFPRPKVDSSFLRLDIRKSTLFTGKQEKLLFNIIRAAFNQRRKTLRNSLFSTIASEKQELFFNKFAIDRNSRPEDLSLRDFANLANI